MMKAAKPMKPHRLIMNPAHGLVRHSVSQAVKPIIPESSRAVGFFTWSNSSQVIDVYL
jgi:hypothetical protein